MGQVGLGIPAGKQAGPKKINSTGLEMKLLKQVGWKSERAVPGRITEAVRPMLRSELGLSKAA